MAGLGIEAGLLGGLNTYFAKLRLLIVILTYYKGFSVVLIEYMHIPVTVSRSNLVVAPRSSVIYISDWAMHSTFLT